LGCGLPLKTETDKSLELELSGENSSRDAEEACKLVLLQPCSSVLFFFGGTGV
jgi:hypothetical protein